MPKQGVLILECLDGTDPGSEGQFLLHMFNLMRVDAQYIEVRTKRQLLSLLDRPPFRIIHVTTHGSVVEGGPNAKPRFRGLWSPTDDLTLSDLDRLKGKLRHRSVVTTACMSAARRFARRFVARTECEYYVAPRRSPSYATAIFFAHHFYHKYFKLPNKYQRDIQKIVEDYDDRYKNLARFVVIKRQHEENELTP